MANEPSEIPASANGEPAWAIATLFPPQGMWSSEEFLALDTNRLVEFDNGTLEVLPVPTEFHQLIVAFLYRALFDWAKPRSAGCVLMAPMRIQITSGKFREPDVLFMAAENASRRHAKFWEGADFVIEVISEDDPQRDLVTKRNEYAAAGIPEYWIVDPRDKSILVLELDLQSSEYVERDCRGDGDLARSATLTGFEVSISATFDHSTE